LGLNRTVVLGHFLLKLVELFLRGLLSLFRTLRVVDRGFVSPRLASCANKTGQKMKVRYTLNALADGSWIVLEDIGICDLRAVSWDWMLVG